MTLFKNKYRIESFRLKNWDYRNAGAYFITICTKNRAHYFGEITDGEMQLSQIGKIVENEWIKTFQREELPEKLESQHVKKWVDKIIVSDLRDVHVYLTMQNWKNYFPEEWMEE